MSTYINIFKDRSTFDYLSQFGDNLTPILNNYKFGLGEPNSVWFNQQHFKDSFLTTDKDGQQSPLVKDPKFNLNFLYIPNYPALFLINLIYKGEDVLIEDYACGAGYFTYYLSKLGFKKWSLIDGFTQVERGLLENVLSESGVEYTINNYSANPTVVNCVGYPWYYNKLPLSAELVCFYPCDHILDTVVYHLKEQGYRELCWDSDKLQVFLCKPEKYNEFMNKIQPYV